MCNDIQEQPVVTIKSVFSIIDENIVACYRVYFDESGTDHGAKYILVAGCMMQEDAWLALDGSWRYILKEYNLSRFRASDCEAAQGTFKGWSRQQRDEIFLRLVNELNNQEWTIIRIVINRQVFESVLQKYPSIIVSPYEFCIIWSVQIGGLLTKIAKQGDEVGLFVEQGPAIRQHVRSHIYGVIKRPDYPVTSLTFPCKENLVPFQVADLIVWEYQKYLRNREKDQNISMRPSLNAITQQPKERFFSGDFGRQKDLSVHFDVLQGAYPNGFRPPC